MFGQAHAALAHLTPYSSGSCTCQQHDLQTPTISVHTRCGAACFLFVQGLTWDMQGRWRVRINFRGQQQARKRNDDLHDTVLMFGTLVYAQITQMYNA
jgi:hypothetical protein